MYAIDNATNQIIPMDISLTWGTVVYVYIYIVIPVPKLSKTQITLYNNILLT